jgi:MFS family permease
MWCFGEFIQSPEHHIKARTPFFYPPLEYPNWGMTTTPVNVYHDSVNHFARRMPMQANSQFSSNQPKGMAGFTLVFAGQLVSVLASNMSGFGLSIWMFQQTGSATAMSAMQVSFILPFMLITPFAGALVDRHNRKLMMMVSDLVAVLATAGLLLLQATGQLHFWHLYVANVFYGLGNAFQWPAYSAAISTMVPKEQYGRANGMMSLIDSGPSVFAPILAGALLPIVKLSGILAIDVLTFFIAIGALLCVHVPQPEKTVEGQAGKGSLMKEIAFGFKYIFERKSLRVYLTIILSLNLAGGISNAVYTPMILARTNQNSVTFGAVLTASAIGAVAGGLIMSAWGGFKKRILTMLSGWAIFAVIGEMLFGISRWPVVWMATTAIAGMIFPITNGAAQSIWQSKVAPDVQGRVFSARKTIAWFAEPIMPLVAGALADFVTEPAMKAQTPFAQVASHLVGSGPGSGMGLQFILSGLLYLILITIAFLTPAFRNMETLLPDHDQMKKVAETQTGTAIEIQATQVQEAQATA